MQILLTFITVVLLGIDWLQTLYIAGHPNEYEETNIILGKHPTAQRVTAYFAICVAIFVAIGLLSNPLCAFIVLGLVCIVEVKCIVQNYKIGIRL